MAERRFEESLAFRRQLSDRFSVAVEIANLGDLAAQQGDLAGAARRLGETLEVARELNSQYLVLNLLPSLGALAARAGDDEAAARLLGATDAVSRSSGLIPDPGIWQPVMDEVAARLGELAPRRAIPSCVSEAGGRAYTAVRQRVARHFENPHPRYRQGRAVG